MRPRPGLGSRGHRAIVHFVGDDCDAARPDVLASAMVSNHRGDVVGERTFGLASEQKLITLDDGSALILTVANYYNPDGKAILEEGVIPTETVRAVAQDDADSDGANDGGAAPQQQSPSDPSLGPRPLSPEDQIYRKALELLNAPPVKKAA